MLVSENSILLVNFALALPDGEVIDSNLDDEPLRYHMGSDDMLPGFERCLLGMGIGQTRTFVVPPEQAFGEINQDNHHRFARSQVPAGIELQVGLVLAFSDASGAEVPGVVADFGSDYVDVDFNHPLAGQEICFTARVHDILR